MDCKNPTFNVNGTIDVEYNHPEYGLIPFTADPNDPEPLGQEIYARAIAGEFGEIAASPSIPLDEQKLLRVNEVNTARDLGLNNPLATVKTGDITWQVDPVSMSELNDAITLFSELGGTPEGFTWRCADNINHPATLSLLLEIGAARAQQKQAIWTASWTLKAQINNAKSAEALNSIEIPEVL